jgi:hypothetical protein
MGAGGLQLRNHDYPHASIPPPILLFRIATAEHVFHESIIVVTIITRVVSFQTIPMISE